MESLGTSIEIAHQYGADRWGIRLAADSIMLKVGLHEVLQVGEWDLPFHLIVDKNTVPLGLRNRPELWFYQGEDRDGNPIATGVYPSNPGSEACNMPFEMVKYAYQQLSGSHIEIISRAVKRPKHPSTRATHSPELIQFISEELGRPLPQPKYWDTLGENRLPLIAEELPDDELFTEMARRGRSQCAQKEIVVQGNSVSSIMAHDVVSAGFPSRKVTVQRRQESFTCITSFHCQRSRKVTRLIR